MIHVVTTCADIATARRLASAAIGARLAACVQVTPGIVSLFHWEGRVDEEEELRVEFKTREARREALVALIEAEHPYDLPVITWEAVGTTEAAGAWLEAETAPPEA